MTRTLWVREEYLQDILKGEKTIEVRVGYPNILRLQRGDIVQLNECYPVAIRRIAHYRTFEELLEAEAVQAIAPHLSATELLSTLRSIYPPEKEHLGVVALELELTSSAGAP